MTRQDTVGGGMAAFIPTPHEQQSGLSRQRWAEGLIEQLPDNHDGRNSWLLNFGIGEAAQALRKEQHWPWSDEHQSATPKHIHVAGTLVGKHIDCCACCGADIRHKIHHSTNFRMEYRAALKTAGGGE